MILLRYLIYFGVYLGLIFIHAPDLLATRHGPANAVSAEISELARAHQPAPKAGPDSWPLIVRAFDLHQQVAAEFAFTVRSEHREPFEARPDYTTILPGATWPEDPDLRDQIRESSVRAMTALRDRGVSDLLAAAARAPRAIVPSDDSIVYMLDYTPIRHFTRLCRARLHLAATAGDWGEAADSVEQALALARISAQQIATLPRTIAGATLSTILSDLRAEIVAQGPPPAPILERLLTILQPDLPWPPLAATIESDHIEFRGMAQVAFTSAGPNGDGLALLNFIDVLRIRDPDVLFLRVMAAMDENGGELSPLHIYSSPLHNLFAPAFATKHQTLAAATPFFDVFVKSAHLDRPARTAALTIAAAYLADLPPHHAVTRILLYDHLESLCGTLETNDTANLNLHATRLVLAIELHHARHNRYPATLADLTTAHILPVIPTDPVSGHPFIYRPLDPTTDPHSRPYLLYSRGHDATDNNATPHPEHNTESLNPKLPPGTDYIINAPRAD